MTADVSLRGRLLGTAASYRHVREEHRRARGGGHARRRLEARLEELAAGFERLLETAALDDAVREQWRRHLYHGGPEPELPDAAPATPPSAHRATRTRGRGSAPLWQR